MSNEFSTLARQQRYALTGIVELEGTEIDIVSGAGEVAAWALGLLGTGLAVATIAVCPPAAVVVAMTAPAIGAYYGMKL